MRNRNGCCRVILRDAVEHLCVREEMLYFRRRERWMFRAEKQAGLTEQQKIRLLLQDQHKPPNHF